MPKRTDIKKVMVIGSGPIVIGQAAEFDYAGTQACLALKEEGYEVDVYKRQTWKREADWKIWWRSKEYMENLCLSLIHI